MENGWEKWLEGTHPDIYDRWLDIGCYGDFWPGWERYAREYLEEEYPDLEEEYGTRIS